MLLSCVIFLSFLLDTHLEGDFLLSEKNGSACVMVVRETII